jgi:hypothetical protein
MTYIIYGSSFNSRCVQLQTNYFNFNLRKLAVKEPRKDVRALKLPNFIVNSNYSDCMHFLGYSVQHDVNRNSYLQMHWPKD